MSIALLSTSNYSSFTFPYPSYHFICFSYILRFATTSLGWIIFQLLFTRITFFFFLPSSLSRNTNHCFLPEPTAFCNLHLGYLCLCGESFKLVSATEVAIISVELRGGGEWAWLYILRLRAITASFACLAMRSQRPPAARSRAAARAFSLRFFARPSSKSIDSVQFASDLHCYLVGRASSLCGPVGGSIAGASVPRARQHHL